MHQDLYACDLWPARVCVCVTQIAMSVLVNPPKPGDPSYEQYNKERTTELASLRR